MNTLSEASLILLQSAGLHPPYKLHNIHGGGNNKVFQIEHASGSVLLKSYFSDPSDTRARAATEFTFSQYAWSCGTRCIAQPLACDPKQSLALYQYIEGSKCTSGQITQQLVEKALSFIYQINDADKIKGAALPNASESCFSIAAHFECVERRISRLREEIDQNSECGIEAYNFVNQELLAGWSHIAEKIRANLTCLGISFIAELSRRNRIISPSDFGFHNALINTNGELIFIDFEYAGWDDPAKLCGDFFNQNAVPIPDRFFDLFSSTVTKLSYQQSDQQELENKRLKLMLPVYTVKWCCIILNEFLPSAQKRRQFAKGQQALSVRAQQLEKAKHGLQKALLAVNDFV